MKRPWSISYYLPLFADGTGAENRLSFTSSYLPISLKEKLYEAAVRTKSKSIIHYFLNLQIQTLWSPWIFASAEYLVTDSSF